MKIPGVTKKEAKGVAWWELVGTRSEQAYFIENLSMLAGSGMGVEQSLRSIEADLRTRGMRKVVGQVRTDIEDGFPVWKALARAGLFKDHLISLVRVGEESGKLSANLKLIAETLEKDRLFQSKIRSAMMYPVFVLGLTLVVGIGIAWFILPRLATVFAGLDLELPFITRVLIGTGVFLEANGAVVIPLVLAFFGIVLYLLFGFRKTKFIGQRMLFAIPGVTELIREVEITRFGYLLGTLLQAGVPVVRALDSVKDATVFPFYRSFYEHIRDGVRDGNSFETSFKSYPGASKLIPTPIQQLIVSGEQSGKLSATFIRVSDAYEAKMDQTTKNLTVILEPILLVIVWLGVVAVALAVILPIYSIIGGLNASP